MEEKDFFAKLAGIGPDGKFSNYSQKKTQNAVKNGFNNKSQNGNGFKIERENDDEKSKSVKIKEQESELAEENIPDEPEGQLAVDVCETLNNFVLEAPVAGVRAEDIDIAITLDSITIKGRRSKEETAEEKNYLYQECFWGRFIRSITFSQEVDADRSSASFKNGILRVIIPKIQRDKPKKIKVRFE